MEHSLFEKEYALDVLMRRDIEWFCFLMDNLEYVFLRFPLLDDFLMRKSMR